MATPSAGMEGRPRGREEVREALLQAATELFAEQGPASVTVRDISERAGVNHALLHRHFGTKEKLLGELLNRVRAQLLSAAGEGGGSESVVDLFRAAASNPIWRILAWSILDGAYSADSQDAYPVVERLVDFYKSEKDAGQLDDALDPNVTAAATAALGLGWLLFEPFLLRAAGLDEEPVADVRRQFDETLMILLGRLGPRDHNEGT